MVHCAASVEFILDNTTNTDNKCSIKIQPFNITIAFGDTFWVTKPFEGGVPISSQNTDGASAFIRKSFTVNIKNRQYE